MRTSYVLIGSGVAVAGLVGVGMLLAARRWESNTRDVRTRLEAANALRAFTYSEHELVGLPAPVARYFRAVLTDGQPVIAHARVNSSGTFNMGEPSADRWKPFTAVQDFYPGAPGFVWDARIRMAPGIDAFVRDAFVNGQGSMFGAAGGVVTVVDSRGTPEIAAGALMRYLAEAPWFPTALLPSHGIRWVPVSDQSARATLTVGSTTVAVKFSFGADGLATDCSALRDNDQLKSKQPWGGRYSRWITRDGMKVPGEAEVFWRLPAGDFPYWRGTIDPVYEFHPIAERP